MIGSSGDRILVKVVPSVVVLVVLIVLIAVLIVIRCLIYCRYKNKKGRDYFREVLFCLL